MKSTTRLLFVLLSLPATVMAADAYFGMQNGGTVKVDPDTNRATITQDGVTTPLWDGTHRMEDGSILIIRQGEVVPNEPVLEARERPKPQEEEWAAEPIVGYTPCERLVRRVCGREEQCADDEACNLARQLLNMEQDERADADNPNLTTYTSARCLGVEKDVGVFPACKQDQH